MLRFRHIRLGRIMEPRANVFAFKRRTFSSPTPSDEMIISDSEPERERERERLRRANGRSQPTTQRRQPVQPTRHKTPVKEGVIDISDDSTISGSNGSIIVLTDTEQSQSVETSQRRLTTFYDAQSEVTNRNITTRKAKPSPRKFVAEESSESDSPNTDFSKYSYKGMPPARSHTTSATALPLKQPDKPPTRRFHTDSFSYTDAELRLLSRCPACSLSWTVRKTVPHKLDHIRSCKRKNNLSDEQIKKRIAEYLFQTPLVPGPGSGSGSKSKSRGKEKGRTSDVVDVESSGPTTLLDDTVKVAEPKKGGRRKATATTVVGVQQQHENMNARARNFFSSFDGGNRDFSFNNAGGDNSGSASPHIPLTQAFPASKLGTTPTLDLNGHSYSSDSPTTTPLSDDDDRYELHPTNSNRQDFYSRHTNSRQISPGPTLSSPSQGIQRLPASQPNHFQTLNTEAETTWNDTEDYSNSYSYNEWHRDPSDGELVRAYDEWYPEPRKRRSLDRVENDYSQPDVLTTSMANITLNKRDQSPGSTSISTDIQGSPDRDPSSSKTRKTSSPAKAPKTPAKRYPPKRLDQKSQKEFDEFLTNAIESDPPLYLRLLRFEPIDINNIYALVGVGTGGLGDGSSSAATGEIKLTPTLQRSLRDFLDRKGIVYYDSTARKR